MLNACFVIHTPRWPSSTSTSRMAGHSHKNAHYNRAKFLLLHTFQWTTWAAGSSGLAKRRSETYLCCTIYTYLAAICAEILRHIYVQVNCRPDWLCLAKWCSMPEWRKADNLVIHTPSGWLLYFEYLINRPDFLLPAYLPSVERDKAQNGRASLWSAVHVVTKRNV